MSDNLRVLRARRVGKGKAHVAHVYPDDNYWFPYRTALCGREYPGEVLTDERIEIVSVCAQCQRHLDRLGEMQAA